jgi:hypothetical protein
MTNRVLVSCPAKGLRKEGSMIPPKKYTDLGAWLKSARRVIPDIPELGGPSNWVINEEIVSPKTIMFKLSNHNQLELAVVIERKGAMSKT